MAIILSEDQRLWHDGATREDRGQIFAIGRQHGTNLVFGHYIAIQSPPLIYEFVLQRLIASLARQLIAPGENDSLLNATAILCNIRPDAIEQEINVHSIGDRAFI